MVSLISRRWLDDIVMIPYRSLLNLLWLRLRFVQDSLKVHIVSASFCNGSIKTIVRFTFYYFQFQFTPYRSLSQKPENERFEHSPQAFQSILPLKKDALQVPLYVWDVKQSREFNPMTFDRRSFVWKWSSDFVFSCALVNVATCMKTQEATSSRRTQCHTTNSGHRMQVLFLTSITVGRSLPSLWSHAY